MSLNGEYSARLHVRAIHQDRACAAVSGVATNVCSRKIEFLPDETHKETSRLDLSLVERSVHPYLNWNEIKSFRHIRDLPLHALRAPCGLRCESHASQAHVRGLVCILSSRAYRISGRQQPSLLRPPFRLFWLSAVCQSAQPQLRSRESP